MHQSTITEIMRIVRSLSNECRTDPDLRRPHNFFGFLIGYLPNRAQEKKTNSADGVKYAFARFEILFHSTIQANMTSREDLVAAFLESAVVS